MFKFVVRLFPNNRYFQLLFYKAHADLLTEASRYFIGYIWWVIEPVIDMVVYYLVFGIFLKRSTDNFVPFLLIGLLAFRWFSVSIISGSNSIVLNKPLMNQVFLPKIIFPTVSVISNTFKYFITLSLLLIFLNIYGFSVFTPYIALPIIIFIQFVHILSITWLLGGLVPFYPDLRIAIDSFMRLIFFLSGIFFSVKSLNPKLQKILYLNPMTVIIESYRNILMYGQWPDWNILLYVFIVSLLLGLIGSFIIRKYDYHYPKLV
jgi:lipopolysaccharide transport system permease protein